MLYSKDKKNWPKGIAKLLTNYCLNLYSNQLSELRDKADLLIAFKYLEHIHNMNWVKIGSFISHCPIP